MFAEVNDPYWHETTRKQSTEVFYRRLDAPFKVVNYYRSLWRWKLNISLLVEAHRQSEDYPHSPAFVRVQRTRR